MRKTPLQSLTESDTVHDLSPWDVTFHAPSEEERRQSQKMEALGRLASGVAHDFNNLLTVITGYSQLLLNRAGIQPEMRDELLQIQNASERASAFTRQLLAFGSKQNCTPEILDLNTVVVDQARMLRPLLGDDIELVTVLTPSLPPIEASAAQILQILLNLGANARDAMPHGGQLTLATASGGPLTAREDRAAGSDYDDAPTRSRHAGDRNDAPSKLPAVRSSRTPGASVVLRVTDNGVGMEEHVRARVFEPFFSTKPTGRGTGLGLATVAELVRLMHGQITVESAPGRGTTFTISFPEARHESAAPVALPPAVASSVGTETILVVEDADYVRTLMHRVLTMNGYHVIQASSAQQALKLVAEQGATIDLVITDIVMPRMSGRQLVQRLQVQQPDLPFLYVSGYSANAVGADETDMSTEPFLPKPFTPDMLLAKVRDLLASAKPAA